MDRFTVINYKPLTTIEDYTSFLQHDDIEKLKYIKPKQKLIKIDELEYKNFLEFKRLNEIKNI